MATHKSSEKRARQDLKRRLRNRSNMSAMKTAMKKVREAVESKDLTNITELLRQAQSTIAKTKKKGSIHKNNMARRISRLAALVNKARAVPSQK